MLRIEPEDGPLVEAYKRAMLNKLPPPVEWPKAPPGTNARLLPLAGTNINSLHIPGQARISIEKEKDPGGCKGGICVEVWYEKVLPRGETLALIDAHINGADEIRPNGYVIGPGRNLKDFGPILQELDDHLVKLGLLPPKDQSKSQE